MFAVNQAIAARDPAMLLDALTHESLSICAFVAAVTLIETEDWWESHHGPVLEVLSRKGPPWLFALYEDLPQSPMVVAEYSKYLLETPCIDPALALHVAERAANLIVVKEGMNWVGRTVTAHYLSALLACAQYVRAAEVAMAVGKDDSAWHGTGICLLYFLSIASPSMPLPDDWNDRLQLVGTGRLIDFIAFHEDAADLNNRYRNACAVIEHYRRGFAVPMAGTSVQVPVDLIIHVLEAVAASQAATRIRQHLKVIVAELMYCD